MGYVCSNIDLHDPQSNRYFEIDLFIACPFGLYVVELKHWTGKIKVLPYSWSVNGFSRSDPHKANNHKAKLIRGICERKFSYLNIPFAESVVTLTHPEAITEGCSNPGTAKNQPTFDGIGRLVDYLKNQKTKKTSLISKDDAKGICNFIGDLHKPGLAKDIQFPGYEIVERLYQAEDRAEFITRPTHLGNRSMTRLRIFFNAGYDRGTGVDHTQIEKARATLNTIAKMKDHPNLLRVLALPNQEGHLIEASDWSEQGTLQDLIALNSSLEMELSLAVITGILKGLEAIHERGVVHRNLCPENILMVENTPKLMNFDLSYQLENRNLTVIPDPSSLKRSPYIAPEIYDLGEDLAENADLFSVGVLLYQMLTGEVPFKCSLDLGQTNGHLSPAGVDQLKKTNVPQKMIDLIQCLIQSEPMHRPASVRVVLEALAPFSPFKGMGMNAELNPGDMHEQFKIIKFIKKGADSQIYKALGPMGQQLFLKLFNIDVPQKRIIREKQMSTAVSHGSIVKAQYCQPWKDRRYLLAFNWIDGIPIHGPGRQELPEPDIFNQVASTLLKALEGLHSYEEEDELNPVLHNDIKPDNILLTDEMRPMLIDFGIASHPEIGLYSGSTGYVSPDSILGEDRNYSIQGDLFGLGVTLFEWFFGKKPYDRLILDAKVVDMHSLRLGLESSLEQWFLKAVAVKAEDRFESAAQMYEDLQIALGVAEDSSKEKEAGKIEMPGEDKYTAIDGEEPEGISIYPMPEMGPNPFVAYLNTLHNRDAANGNALAESQACNEWFGHIQVEHPLTGKIMDKLLMQGHHVILTGHAGDGKSTIGLEVYKRLKNLPTQNKLDRELKPREDVEADGASISIIKDFSEWDDEAKIQLIDQAGEKGAPTILLISNTGTLLDAFHKLDDQQGRSRLEMENDLLKVFSQSRPAPVIHNGVSYFVINLAMFDNLVLARTIFERMVCKDRWEECLSCEKSEKCTINRNVRLLQENPIAIDRIFFLYRRMFEYKDRFTLRQLIAHMAYMITAGMEYADILNYASAPEPPRMTEFMFFNRFFGDSGRHPDKPARQMQIIRTLIDRELGQKPCPSWERRLWLSDPQSDFKLCVKGLSSDFDRLRRIGGGVKISDIYSGETGKKSARQQVRRILFFLQKFSADEKAGNIYLSCFLNSPMLLPLLKWRVAPKKFSTTEEQHLRQQVMHVLQEQFAGIRLPEQESGLKQLYITLNRNDREMRQATQVVLADFASKDFKIEWEKNTTGEGIAPSLIFSGTGPYEDATLNLALPFLDYVRMRQQGETGQDLQTSFSDRIEYFKAQLIRINPSDRSANDMVLLRLQTNHRFREYRVIVADNKLEVINA
ncbi:MAG: protein kinase [Desulfobacterium sp.]|nr:protein kinase [Desulfobacterium sp.]